MKFASGYGGSVGVSENANVFEPNWWTSKDENLYMWDGDGLDIYEKKKGALYNVDGTFLDSTEDFDWDDNYEAMKGEIVSDQVISTNASVDNNGVISGHKAQKK